MTDNHYILDGKKLIKVDLLTWAKWLETAGKKRIVKQEKLKNGKWVSTVFLGLDYSFGGSIPLLFETMIFPSKGNYGELDMDRYSTWEEAEQGHKEMVKKWK
jgi:hypothetical protein